MRNRTQMCMIEQEFTRDENIIYRYDFTKVSLTARSLIFKIRKTYIDVLVNARYSTIGSVLLM